MSVDVRFVLPELSRLDHLKAEALCLPLPTDERPLRGVLGLIDWRLCARISRMIAAGRVSGEPSEMVLMPARPKLSFDKLFLYGVGAASVSADRFEQSVGGLLDTLAKARIRSAVIDLPQTQALEPEATIERFLKLQARVDGFDDLSLIEDLRRQRGMKPVVENFRRRRRAALSEIE